MKTSMTLAQGWHANLWWVQYFRGGKRQAKREDNILVNKVVLHRGKDEKKKVRETQVRQQVLREGIRGQTHWNHTHRKLVHLITLGSQPCLTQWNQAMPVGQPKTGESWWKGLTECGPLEKGMANHFSILALRTPWTVWKGKMIGYWKRNSPGQ